MEQKEDDFPFLMYNVRCTGTGSRLTECAYDGVCDKGTCTMNDVAGVQCYPGKSKYKFSDERHRKFVKNINF